MDPPSEAEMIRHIHYITQDILPPDPQSPTRPFSPFQTTSKTYYPTKYHLTAPGHQESYRQVKHQESYRQVKNQVKVSLQPSEEGRKKRRGIFEKKESSEGIGRLEREAGHTPLMDRINKNIYSRFKTEAQNLRQLTLEKTKSPSESEQIWRDFLKRENDWLEEKKQTYRELKMREQQRGSSKSPEGRKPRNRSRNGRGERSGVEWRIEQLKEQSERVRARASGEEGREKGRLVKTLWEEGREKGRLVKTLGA